MMTSLSCYCPDASDYCEWYYVSPRDYIEHTGSRRKRCRSCRIQIDRGATCIAFRRWRDPRSYVEESIHGEAVMLASWYYCETCADLYFSLTELGFCFDIEENMRELVKEYARDYGSQPVSG